MTEGLPWDDPDSDPVADMRACMKAWEAEYLAGASLNDRQRWQFFAWSTQHMVGCGGSFLYERDNAWTKWIQCAHCNSRLILPMGRDSRIEGPHPTQIVIDEITDWPRDLSSQPLHTADNLLDLCLEHPWLSKQPTSAGDCAGAIPPTKSATWAGSSAPPPAAS